ncbi:hypothetical protein E3P98_00654 [Wallemia ichthyophaga]|nr:hypothetical protein E3P98_00654 [Wallemia ichthyophaga]
MSVNAEILGSAEIIISHHNQSSADHLERFQGLLRDDLNGLVNLSAQDHSRLLKAINSLLSNNVQGDEELLDICLSFGSPGNKFSTRKKALKVLIQLYSKKPKKEISARTAQIIECLVDIPKHAPSLLSLALHSLLVAITKLTLTPQHVQSFVELFLSNVLSLLQKEDICVRRCPSISSIRSVASDKSAEISHNWRSKDDHASDIEDFDYNDRSSRDETSDVILQATMCISQLAKTHIKFVFNHIFKLFPDTAPHLASPLTLWDILQSDKVNNIAKAATIHCMEDILRLSRPFLIQLGFLLLESHNRAADCLHDETDADIQLGLLDLADCLLNVTPYAKMTSETPKSLCNQVKTVVLSLYDLEESNKTAVLRVCMSMIAMNTFKEDLDSLREMSSYLLRQIYDNVLSSQIKFKTAQVLASIWISLPDPERKGNVKALFSKLFNEDSIEAKSSSLLLLSLHPDIILEQDESVLEKSYLFSRGDVAFQRNFLVLMGALFSEHHLSYKTLNSMVDWVIESISADNESIKLAGLSAIRKSFFNACNDVYSQKLEKACVVCLGEALHAVKQNAGFALADYMDALQPPFKLTNLKPINKNIFINVSPMAVFQIGGHVLTSMAISRVPVSTVHTIKALSPLFTVLSYKFLFKVNYSTQTYLSLLPLTIGVMLAMSFDMSLLNTPGLVYALLSTFVFVSQNIFSKKLLPSDTQKHSSQKLDKLNLLFYSSLMAFTSMIPLWFYSDFGHVRNLLFIGSSVDRPVGFSLCILSNGFVHFIQNLVAFAILAATSPVTYSIASLTKRIAVICLAIIYFKQSVHFIQIIGIVMTGVGLYLYNKSKQDVNKGEVKVRRDEALRDFALPTTKSDDKFLSGKESPWQQYTSSAAFYPITNNPSENVMEMPAYTNNLANYQVKYRQDHAYPSPPTSVDSSPPQPASPDLEVEDKAPTRLTSKYDNLDQLSSAFNVKHTTQSYQAQFASLYYLRLAKLKKLTQNRSINKWNEIPGQSQKPKFHSRVLDVEQNKLSYLVGTIYMDMKLKPNVLDDLARNHWVAAPQPTEKMYSDNDELCLEDESGRIKLVGPIIARTQLVTGIIIGVLGIEKDPGEFTVLDVCYPGIPPQATNITSMDSDKSPLVAVVSGLRLGSQGANDALTRRMLIDFITGQQGGSTDQSLSSRITRLVIAGNCMSPPIADEDKKPKRFGKDRATYSSLPSTDFDRFLVELSNYVDIDILPGPDDPAGTLLPQQPFPKAMFKGAHDNFEQGSVVCHTNPTWFSIDETRILVSGGQTLDDSFKYVKSHDRLGLAVDSLKWRHIAPTAPDTLWCYPFTDKDPFILSECPHIFINGNQKEFETELIDGPEGQQARVVNIPQFTDKSVIALVNLDTLDCEPVTFIPDAALDGEEEPLNGVAKKEGKEEEEDLIPNDDIGEL